MRRTGCFSYRLSSIALSLIRLPVISGLYFIGNVINLLGYRNKRWVAGKREEYLRVKRYSFQGERWSRKNLTWSLRKIGKTYQLSNQVTELNRESLRRVLGLALDMWARHTELQFTEAHPDDETADLQGKNA